MSRFRTLVVPVAVVLTAVLTLYWYFREEPGVQTAIAPNTPHARASEQADDLPRPGSRLSSTDAAPSPQVPFRDSTLSPRAGSKRTGDDHLVVTWRVQVVDRVSSAPVENAKVTLRRQLDNDSVVQRFTDKSGSTLFEIGNGRYTITTAHEHYFPAQLDIDPTLDTGAGGSRLELVARAALRGRVRNQNGLGVSDATITARSAAGTGRSDTVISQSRPDGSFEIQLAPGDYEVTVSKQPLGEVMRSVSVPPPGSEPLDITLVEGGPVVRFTGRVLAESGHPLSRASVSIASVSTGGRINYLDTAVTDGRGSFTVQTRPQREVLASVEASEDFEALEVTLDLSRDLRRDFRLRRRATFSVAVYDAAGRRLEEGVQVKGVSPDGGTAALQPTATPGRFYATNYPLQIYAEALGVGLGISDVVTVEHFQPEIQLTMRATGQLRGAVTDANGSPVREFFVVLKGSGLVEASARVASGNGSFAFRNLPRDSYQLLVRGENLRSTARKVVVEEGRTTMVEVVLLKPEAETGSPIE